MNSEMQETRKKINSSLKDVKHKIAVMSNKGGVGKSAVSTLLAYAFAQKHSKVGLLDADIHGPSMVKTMGMEDQDLRVDNHECILPVEKGNIKLVSSAMMLESEDMPLIWRGPMKSNLIKQFLADVQWGELDYLIVDSPPGTGDEPMTVLQLMEDVSGAVIVTTPQQIALLDARKCVTFLRQMKIPVLGIIENMGTMLCPHCSKEIELFEKGGGENAALELAVPFLGRFSFEPDLVKAMDRGDNFMEKFPGSILNSQVDQVIGNLDIK